MSILGKTWKVKNTDSSQSASQKILTNRGLTEPNQVRAFLELNYKKGFHNPFLMKDMEKAVERVRKAIARQERIMVFGDYDVDGTTAVATVFSFFNQFYLNVDFYIPDRYAEGYGISYKGIDWAAEQGFKVIIALDCGIKSIAHIDYAFEKGV